MYASPHYGSPVTREPSPVPTSTTTNTSNTSNTSAPSTASAGHFWRRSLATLSRRERSFVRRPPYTTLRATRREEVLVWVIEVCSELSLSQAVVSLTRSILDRFISININIKGNLAAAASAALLIATKVSEDLYPDVLLAALSNLSGADTSSILRTESVILALLDWRVNIVTPHEVTKELLHHLVIILNININIPHINYVMSTIESLLLASELEYSLIDTPPSVIAAAATIVAFDSAHQPELCLHTAILARDNAFDMAAVKHTVDLLHDSLRKINNNNNNNSNTNINGINSLSQQTKAHTDNIGNAMEMLLEEDGDDSDRDL